MRGRGWWRAAPAGTVAKRTRCLAAVALVALLAASGCGDATGPRPAVELPLALALQAADGISAAESAALGDVFDTVDRFRITVSDSVSRAVYADTVIAVTPGADSHTLVVNLPEEALGALLSIEVVAFAGETQLFSATTTATVTEDAPEADAEAPVRYTGPGLRGSVTNAQDAGVSGVTVTLLSGGAEAAQTTTGDDGTFLFAQLAPGTYTVRIEPPSGLTPCPAQREVTLEGSSTTAVAAFQVQEGTCTIRVLVVSGGDVDDTGTAASMVSGPSGVSVGSFFFVNALPGIETLRRYDVVLLYQNGLFDESASLGSQIAEYVSLGGNVVFGSFYWQGRSDSGIGSVGWGGLESMDPFSSAGGATYTPGSLGSVSEHPLTAGVTALESTSGFRGGAVPRGGTSVVASWSDGSALVGHRTGGSGQRLVAVSLYPAHAALGGISGDYQTLWQNAVTWAGAAGGPARTGPVGGNF